MSAALPPSIASILPPHEEFGPRRTSGIGLTVRQHAMAATGHRTVVFGGRQDGPVFLDVTFRLVKPPFFIPGPSWMRYVLGLIRQLRALRPALIEVHAAPKVALCLQRLFPRIPVVLVLYDDPAGSRHTRSPARRTRLFNRLSRIVTVSEWLRDRVLDRIEPPSRAPIVIPPAVDLANLLPIASGIEAAGNASARRRTRIVLFVGRLVPEKGADQFVAACTAALPSLPGWRAEIIGASEHMVKAPETTFVRLLQATAEPASISMMGYRDHPDVLSAMARAAIVVIPSRIAEPSGRVALEAMANGAAVICAPSGAMPAICGDAAIYADPLKPTELAAAISALGQDPPRLAALAEAGRQRAAQYDLPRIGRLVDAVYAQIVAERVPKR